MKLCSAVLTAVILMVSLSCNEEEPAGDFQILAYTFDFSASDHGWKHGFADYPAGPEDSSFYELKFSYTSQPSTLTPSKKSIMLSGNNHSDDLFMYIKNLISGLAPGTDYIVTYEVEFASEAEKGSFGIGGSPGESVFLKVGATNIEPQSVIEAGHYKMNIDKGNQAEDGKDMVQIGDISVPENSEGFVLTSRSNASYNNNSSYNKPVIVKSNSEGELWLVVGTDSGFEGITTIYYTRISVVLSRK